MQKWSLTVLVLTLLHICDLQGQIRGNDSIFGLRDLNFYSELEAESFAGFFAGRPDGMALIAGLKPRTGKDQLDTYRKWVDDITLQIGDSKFGRLKPEKKIRRIRAYAGKSLLITYDHQAGFDDLFNYGIYNHYTAAAIYGFLLERLGIPYIIRESPTHLYLVAWPGEEDIILEAGQPGSQYFMFDHETRADFVGYLHTKGVISDPDFYNISDRDLFERFYFASCPIGLTEVAGLLYLNSAVTCLREGQSYDACHQFEKAFVLYPSYKSQYLLLRHLAGFIENMDYRNPRDLGFLVKACRLQDFWVNREMLTVYLADIVTTLLLEEKDEKTLDEVHRYMRNYLKDSLLESEFEFLVRHYYGQLYYEDAFYDEALEYLESAFRIDPENEQNQNLLVAALAGYATQASPGMILQKIEEYDTAFSEIESEDVYHLVKLNTYLSIFGDYFQLQDGENGERYMSAFEQFKKLYPGAEADLMQVGRSYSSAAIFYYRKGMTARARELLNRGLRYAPGNSELRIKLEAIQ